MPNLICEKDSVSREGLYELLCEFVVNKFLCDAKKLESRKVYKRILL